MERVLEQLMDFEVTNGIQAGRHERSEARQTYRNGYRERPLHTRLGTLE
ncbi:MAG: transposase, partial [Candidatus Competibacteraceae bacterium]|nr:transposase [Candidatus Competibacteraceae bacterium]